MLHACYTQFYYLFRYSFFKQIQQKRSYLFNYLFNYKFVARIIAVTILFINEIYFRCSKNIAIFKLTIETILLFVFKTTLKKNGIIIII